MLNCFLQTRPTARLCIAAGALLLLSTQISHSQELPTYVPTNGLVSWWPLDGAAIDISGNENNGVIQGSISNASDRFGNPDKALSFPGNSQSYIKVPLSTSLQIQTELSISAWFYMEGGYYNPRLIQVGNGSSSGYSISVSGTSNSLRTMDALFTNFGGLGAGFCCGNGGNGVPVTALEWVHVVFTVGMNGLASIYINGQLSSTAQGITVDNAVYTTDLNIGRMPHPAYDAWGGKLDDIGIWSRALSELEVQQLYLGNSDGVPCYVPSENLVYWSDFDGTATDQSGNNVSVQLNGTTSTFDRFGNATGAIAFNGFDENAILFPQEGHSFGEELTLAAWVRPDGSSTNGTHPRFFHSSEGFGGGFDRWFLTWSPPSSGEIVSFGIGDGTTVEVESVNALPLNEWTHLAAVFNQGNVAIYLDGQLELTEALSFSSLNHVNAPIYIASAIGNSFFNGAMDEVGVWGRELNADEITALAGTGGSISGCTDESACNFQPMAICDDGECVYPPAGAADCNVGELYCAEGTLWDYENQMCVPNLSCGIGTVYDSATNTCIVDENCPGDYSGDGQVGAADLLIFLTWFGIICADETIDGCTDVSALNYNPSATNDDGTCQPVNAACNGEQFVSYYDHEYSIVAIGDQCWFAENLQTPFYRNGDLIQGELNNTDWATTTSGAQAIYGEGSSSVYMGSGDEILNLELYGRLYNWHAIIDSREICPNNWHVPSDDEWMTLEEELGLPVTDLYSEGWRGADEGQKLKSSPSDNPPWDGINSTGFSGLPGGSRNHIFGYFDGQGLHDAWWSSTYPYARRVDTGVDGIERSIMNGYNWGISVRCVLNN